MPVHTSISIGVSPKTGVALEPGILQAEGPVLQCAVMLDTRRAQAVARSGSAVPPPKSGKLLIDTGASMTSIERTILQELGIPSIGDCQVRTPSGGETQQIYPCGLVSPGSAGRQPPGSRNHRTVGPRRTAQLRLHFQRPIRGVHDRAVVSLAQRPAAGAGPG
jgi:hypothetical protein